LGSPFRTGVEPVSIDVDPSGRFAYTANKFTHNISGYQVDENGILTPLIDAPFPAGSGPDSVVISR
jgi:6-phosphogluconolactonase (cycloisomerase 2 family)